MKRSLFSLGMVAFFAAVWYIVVVVGVDVVPASGGFRDIASQYDWAREAVAYLVEQGIMTGNSDGKFNPEELVTREQLAKMIVIAYNLPIPDNNMQIYSDVPPERWSFQYIKAADKYIYTSGGLFEPSGKVTREVAASALVLAGDLGETVLDSDVLAIFPDSIAMTDEIRNNVAIAFLKGYIQGIDGNLRPNSQVTRAEIAVIFHRALTGAEAPDVPSDGGDTLILGEAQVPAERAKEWAKSRGAADRFIDIADLYWKYGEITGIRADLMYAQAAKETAFGNYTGKVLPEMNNWAGIKKKDSTGDSTEDHESFATPEDGVRAHFNHMCAYLGLDPVGETHERYAVVKTAAWAGTIRTVRELGGRWAPDAEYGVSIARDYLDEMIAF